MRVVVKIPPSNTTGSVQIEISAHLPASPAGFAFLDLEAALPVTFELCYPSCEAPQATIHCDP